MIRLRRLRKSSTGKTEVDPDRAQFRRHEPAALAGKRETVTLIHIVQLADRCSGWQFREAAAEALDTAAFVVDSDQQLRRSQRMQLGYHCVDLLRTRIIAREQHNPADQRVTQHLAVVRRELDPIEIGH